MAPEFLFAGRNHRHLPPGTATCEKFSARESLAISRLKGQSLFDLRQRVERKEEGVQRGISRGTAPATAGSDCCGARSAMADTSTIPSPSRPAAHAAASQPLATSPPSADTRVLSTSVAALPSPAGTPSRLMPHRSAAAARSPFRQPVLCVSGAGSLESATNIEDPVAKGRSDLKVEPQHKRSYDDLVLDGKKTGNDVY